MKSTQNNWEESFDEKFKDCAFRAVVIKRDFGDGKEVELMDRKYMDEEIKSFIRSVEEKAREGGYIFALEVLRSHILEQIYEPTIRTESIIEYIDKAIAHHQSLNK